MGDCDIAELTEVSKDFAAIPAGQREAMNTFLLAFIASQHGGSMDVATLIANAKCFVCLQAGEHRALQTSLICEILNS